MYVSHGRQRVGNRVWIGTCKHVGQDGINRLVNDVIVIRVKLESRYFIKPSTYGSIDVAELNVGIISG